MDIKEINRATIEKFRAGAELGNGMHRERLVLLTTVGRRTGEPRTSPMMFHRDGDRILVIASNMGAPRHPEWYLNLVADPRVRVELDTESYDAVATPLAGAERDRVWAELKRLYPFFADHEAATTPHHPGVARPRLHPRAVRRAGPPSPQPARSRVKGSARSGQLEHRVSGTGAPSAAAISGGISRFPEPSVAITT